MTNLKVLPTQREKIQLAHFERLVQGMINCRIIQKAQTQDHPIKAERIDNETFLMTTPDYDREDFRSFLTIFRQVAVLKDEPIYIIKIMNIESRYANNDLRKEPKEIKLKINPILEGRYVAMKFGVNTEGGDYMLTSRQLLDALVNSNVFHTSIERETETSIIQSSEPWEYIGILLSEIIGPVLRTCTWLVQIIRNNNYLDEVDMKTAGVKG